MTENVESRFAHLLQPIRDLADNWHINIARELEDYLSELEKITFSFDGANTLNFAEAALVIQGSAVVYSKKVEYLYALLYQTLDLLAEKKQKKNQELTTDDNNDAAQDDMPNFLSLDDALKEGTAIDMVEQNNTPIRLPRTSAHILMPIGELDGASSQDDPSVSRKHSTFMDACQIHSSGALVYDCLDPLLRTDAFNYSGPKSVQFSNSATSTPLPNGVTTQDHEMRDSDDEAIGGGIDLPGGLDSDDDVEPVERGEGGEEPERPSIFKELAAGLTEKETVDKGVVNGRRVKSAEAKEKPRKRIVDLWNMMDPHEEVGAIKPFKKGKPYRIPSTKTKAESDAVVPILCIADTPLSFRSIRVTDYLEFDYLYVAELKRRKDAKKKDRYEFTFEETVYGDADEEESGEVPEVSHSDLFRPHFNGSSEPQEEEEERIGGEGFEGAGVADDSDGDAGDPGIVAHEDEEAVPDTQSYEDYYAVRVEQFIAETAQYAHESNLSKRVNDWKDKLAPVLDEQESHPNFDILEYGEAMIHTLKGEYEGKPGVHIDDEGTVEVEEDLIIPFAKLTMGVECYEVARRFAAMLQLVNNENVSVVTTREVDSLSFQLLSVKPKFDIENYLAPSLDPTKKDVIVPTSNSQSKKKAPAHKEKEDEGETGTKKAKRGRPKAAEKGGPSKRGKKDKTDEKQEEAEEEENVREAKKAAKPKTAGTVSADKENVPNGNQRRSARRATAKSYVDDGESEEEILQGPKTKMFAEVEA